MSHQKSLDMSREHMTATEASPSVVSPITLDPLADQEHADQDAAVLAIANGMEITPGIVVDKLAVAAFLLSVIVYRCKDYMKPELLDPEKCAMLLQEHRQLQSMLATALESRTFHAVRCMAILRNPASASICPVISSESTGEVQFGIRDREAMTIEAAWQVPYRGDNHEVLYSEMTTMAKTEDMWSCTAIIQSSGSGKSRMVDEQAKFVFTIPFNLRLSSESELGLSYPPPDSQVREYLVDNTWIAHDISLHYWRFLTHLFQQVRQCLSENAGQKNTCAQLATWWRSYLSGGPPGNSHRKQLYYDLVNALQVEEQEYKGVYSATNGNGTMGTAKTALQDLLEMIGSRIIDKRTIPQDGVKLVLAFDDAQALSPRVPSKFTDDDVPLDHLCAAIAELSGYPGHQLCAIFISRSALARFPLTEPKPDSRRLKRDVLQAPWGQIPFDCSDRFPLSSSPVTLDELGTVEFLTQFGRPLFWALLKGAAEADRATIAAGLVAYARSMLVGTQALTRLAAEESVPDDENRARLAVADVRLLLEYSREHYADVGTTHAAQVERSTRLLYVVPINKSLSAFSSEQRSAFSRAEGGTVPTPKNLYSGFSSEPLIAEAAAQQLAAFSRREGGTLPEILQANRRIVTLGECGETVARVLLTLAYDRAVERRHAPDANSVRYSKGCALVDFVEALFAPDYARAVLDGLPCNMDAGAPLRAAFRDARVRFTHFTPMGPDSEYPDARMEVNTRMMQFAFIRGMAFVLSKEASGVSFLIPVLLSPGPLVESAMTALLVCVRRRVEDKLHTPPHVAVRRIGLFRRQNGRDTRPVISLVMQLKARAGPPGEVQEEASREGAQYDSDSEMRSPSEELPENPAEPPNPDGPVNPDEPSNLGERTNPDDRSQRQVHPHYGIHAYGCSSAVYNVIAPNQDALYQSLLESCFLLASRRPNSAVSKFLWGADSFTWAFPPGTISGDNGEHVEGISTAGRLDDDDDEE
ncbi:hypothetical protein B0H21DRAFT_735354 [Amylocystis lapponica]|nr:hypothetical protein B0H21DRAFT_735354 [Amylocystis lapponica]